MASRLSGRGAFSGSCGDVAGLVGTESGGGFSGTIVRSIMFGTVDTDGFSKGYFGFSSSLAPAFGCGESPRFWRGAGAPVDGVGILGDAIGLLGSRVIPCSWGN